MKKKNAKEIENLSLEDIKKIRLKEWVIIASVVAFIASVGGYCYYRLNYSSTAPTIYKPAKSTNNISVKQEPVQVNKMDSGNNAVQVNSVGNSKIVIKTSK